MKRLLAVHRWLGVAALAQLALWTASGLFFALAPLAEVRGEDRRREQPAPAIDWDQVKAPPRSTVQGAHQVTLRVVEGRPTYVVVTDDSQHLVDAESGKPVVVDEQMAARIARRDQQGQPPVRAVTHISAAPLEYRGKPLPAFRVDLDDGRNTHVYVGVNSATVTARRNDLWRTFDFMWSLHIMDYGQRDDFNHPLLVAFASLGVITVLSGGVIWLVRLRRRWKRRPARSALSESR